MGVEPRASCSSNQCSTTELRQLDKYQPSRSSLCIALVLNVPQWHAHGALGLILGDGWLFDFCLMAVSLLKAPVCVCYEDVSQQALIVLGLCGWLLLYTRTHTLVAYIEG